VRPVSCFLQSRGSTSALPSLLAATVVCCAVIILIAARTARAEIFILNNDGQVQGEEIKVDGTPANQTVIRTAAGGQITLDKSQIKQIIPQRAVEIEYDRIAPTYPDTVDGQLRLADWCRDHSLPKQRQAHLERVITLDTNNRKARLELGFVFIDGRWILPDDQMKQKGYVRYKGAWRLPQEVELMEEKRKAEQAEKDWHGKLVRWRKLLEKHPERSATLRKELLSITDPAAVPALSQLVAGEHSTDVRIELVDALLHIDTPAAIGVVVGRTMDDPDEEVRLTALDRLVAANHPEVVLFYIKALKGDSNAQINQAALCLGKLHDKTAIIPLIESLRTTHHHIEQTGTPGQISTTFMSGPGNNRSGGMSVGGQTKEIVETLDNQQVLTALIAITGVNFQFDQSAWKAWYVGQMRSLNIDARRG
jgi:hypothetical protein